jgi:predicted ABC-type ATPase
MLPHLYLIAGANGSGKTTFAREFLPKFIHCREFLNADLMAEGIAPFAPESNYCCKSIILRSFTK